MQPPVKNSVKDNTLTGAFSLLGRYLPVQDFGKLFKGNELKAVSAEHFDNLADFPGIGFDTGMKVEPVIEFQALYFGYGFHGQLEGVQVEYVIIAGVDVPPDQPFHHVPLPQTDVAPSGDGQVKAQQPLLCQTEFIKAVLSENPVPELAKAAQIQLDSMTGR